MNLRPIFINGRFLTQEITGTQRYAHEIINWLDSKLCESSAGWPSVTILVPPTDRAIPAYKALRIQFVGSSSGQLWEQLELPFYSRRGVLFTPCGGAPAVHPRNVVTIHDAAVFINPKAYSAAFRLWYQFLYRLLCHTSLHVMTVSNMSKRDLERHTGAGAEKFSVTYLGAEHATRYVKPSQILEKHGLKRFGYVFIVGSRSPNKNIERVLEAMDLVGDGLQLVVAGRANSSVFGNKRAPVLPSHVIDLGYVSDSGLRRLYKNAACLIFPSLYEGFGLPPLEALAVGCPVVTSSTSALAEVFGTIAFLCDPENPNDMAEKIAEASSASPEYRERCRDFATIFKWERCARQTWSVVADHCVVGSKASRHIHVLPSSN